jgi:hypothetical protein
MSCRVNVDILGLELFNSNQSKTGHDQRWNGG